ncbi:hypothetical protein [Aquibaculum arenosum]|uniref:Uncharacterized protein n=1 Tax=Aquibaculum arenosum TaxID=3032591 RepID=A0ABT5YJ39_9PROT|nr:hypothetical protein [Fodinicurvata sp. CAU 1616]MDF2094902.1 hypothetical protein [Fodinicurvata sp. CAU 1616]
MTDTQSSHIPLPEIVGQFGTREEFEAAIAALLANGFAHADLSVLDSHEALEAAQDEPWHERLSGMVGEVKYIGPLTTAGFLAVATGPVGAAISVAVGAGVAAMALREALDQVEATPHSETFARALEQGAVLLWVACADAAAEAQARDILLRHGARDVHLHQRKADIPS